MPLTPLERELLEALRESKTISVADGSEDGGIWMSFWFGDATKAKSFFHRIARAERAAGERAASKGETEPLEKLEQHCRTCEQCAMACWYAQPSRLCNIGAELWRSAGEPTRTGATQ